MMRRAAPALLVGVLGVAALYAGTDGFQAFTSEAARRLAVMRAPEAPPRVLLEDQDGRRFTLSDHAGRLVLVDFVYTQCRVLCRVAGAQLQAIERQIAAAGLGTDVMIVTISFDPLRDTPEVLRAHAAKLNADAGRWRFARPVDPAQTARLLRAFGLVAVPDGTGEFQHNGAIHLLARDGRLSAIFDYEQGEAIMRTLKDRA
jgi:protein SCO1/2